MRLKEDTSSWHSNAIVHRDNRHDHSENDEKYKSRKNTRRWCRGKVGVEHEFHRFYRGYYNLYITARCINCGRLSSNKKAQDKSLPLHIEVENKCDCTWDNHYYYHNIEVRHG